MSYTEQIARIVAKGAQVDDRLGPPIKCVRCRDTGVIEFTGGTHRSHRGLEVEATVDRPIYRRCVCLDRKTTA